MLFTKNQWDMKTLRETREIEEYLMNEMDPANRVVFEAKLLIDPILRIRTQFQRTVYAIIRRSARRQLKSELERIHVQLFNDPSRLRFQQEILKLFSK